MRLSRTDLVPVLAIIAGGAVGVLVSGSLVLGSSPNNVPTPVVVVAPPVTVESENDVRPPTSEQILVTGRVRAAPVWSPDGIRVAFTRDGSREVWVVNVDGGTPIRLINTLRLTVNTLPREGR